MENNEVNEKSNSEIFTDDDDSRLQDELQYLMNRFNESDQKLYHPTLQKIKNIIKSATSSITAIPKPLKYMTQHYDKLKTVYKKLRNSDDRILCADIISVLAMTMGTTSNDCISYRIQATAPKVLTPKVQLTEMQPTLNVCDWGHDYVRHLSSEIASAWISYKVINRINNNVCGGGLGVDGKCWSEYECLYKLVHQIVPYTLAHNAESEACDLVMEIDELPILEQYIDERSYDKVSLYMHSCVPYVTDPENYKILRFLLELALKYKRYVEALRFAMILCDSVEIQRVWKDCPDDEVCAKNQMALLLAKQRIKVDGVASGSEGGPEFVLADNCMQSPSATAAATTATTATGVTETVTGVVVDISNSEPSAERLSEIIGNNHINTFFLNLARDLDILEPKSPDDIYKTNLGRSATPTLGRNGHLNLNVLVNQMDSAKNNLAASFVNGFINTGFGIDKMFLDFGSGWVYKNKNHGMISATASLGLIKLWDIDGGLAAIDKYLYSMDEYVKAGALLACGIVNCGVRSEVEPAHAILSDYLQKQQPDVYRVSATLGLGIAYAGTNNTLVLNSLRSLIGDLKHNTNIELLGIAALSIGLISVGQFDSEDVSFLLQHVMSINDDFGQNTYTRFLVLGLGLLQLGCQDKCQTLIATLEVLAEPFRDYVTIVVEMCAFAGTGNVIQIQKFLHICSESTKKKSSVRHGGSSGKTKEEKRNFMQFDYSSGQSAAVIGVALTSLAEDVGNDMCMRTYGNLMRYGEPCIRRMVPLALALSSISNPQNNIMEMLNKFSHDNDPMVVISAIFAIGLIGAGTNNARIGLILRHLANYYNKDPNVLFTIRLAQGLTYMGKGTMTLSPYHNDRQILRRPSLGALLAVIFTMMDAKSLILGSAHYLLYLMVPAIEPRWLITVDNNMNQISVPVRVGVAVDVVAQAGKPKTITGFQTNTTPILLASGERAELATDDYIAIAPVLEGLVVLQKKPIQVSA